jgi:hypothetical protein
MSQSQLLIEAIEDLVNNNEPNINYSLLNTNCLYIFRTIRGFICSGIIEKYGNNNEGEYLLIKNFTIMVDNKFMDPEPNPVIYYTNNIINIKCLTGLL